MARIGRFVVPGLPHHVTQRGNRRERVFFSDADYELYRDLLHEACARETVAVWSYCLMPNHVHLILTPATPEGLGRALGKAHRRYSAFVNARNRVTGHLFQARFSSVVMDEEHLMAAAGITVTLAYLPNYRHSERTGDSEVCTARIGRFVVPGLPHHVTQRGNRRERVFFSDADYELYRDLLHEACSRESVAVWSYCLLPNHVHLILGITVTLAYLINYRHSERTGDSEICTRSAAAKARPQASGRGGRCGQGSTFPGTKASINRQLCMCHRYPRYPPISPDIPSSLRAKRSNPENVRITELR